MTSLLLCAAFAVLLPTMSTLAQPKRTKLCWAHYVGWGFDQVNGYDRAVLDPFWRLQKFNDRSMLGRHAQTDEGVGEATKRQIHTALQYGIDGFCVDLPAHEDSGERFYADSMSRFYRAAEGTPFKIALCVDGSAPSAENMTRMLAAFFSRWGQHPNSCLVDGKPAVFIYNSRPRTLEEWRAILGALRSQGFAAYWLVQPMGEGSLWEHPEILADNLAVFDGFYDFGINGFTPEQMLTRLTRGQKALARHKPGGLLAAGITQGYLGNGNSFYRPFLNTGTLRNNWGAALEADAPWVCITTWNDYVEHTHFEPSTVNRDTLLRINRDYVARWRNEPVPTRPPQLFVSYHEEANLGDDWTLEILSLPYHTAPSFVRMRLLTLSGDPVFEPEAAAIPQEDIRAETVRVPEIGMDGIRLFRVQVQLGTANATNEWFELYPVVVRPGHLESLRTIHIPLDSLAAAPTLTLANASGKRTAQIRFNRWNLAGKVELLRNGWPVSETEFAHKGAPSFTVTLPLPETNATPADLFVARTSNLSGDVAWSAPCVARSGRSAETTNLCPVIVTGSDFDEGWWGGPQRVSRLEQPQLRSIPIVADETFAVTYAMDSGSGSELASVSGWTIPALLGADHKSLRPNPKHAPQWVNDCGRFALRFDGQDDQALLPSRTMPYGPFTLEMNVFPEPTGAVMTLFSEFNRAALLTLTPDAHVCFARNQASVTSKDPLPARHWSHLAAVYDGQSLKLYINSHPAAETSAQAHVIRINSLPIIGHNHGGGQGFAGRLGGFHLQSGSLVPADFVLLKKPFRR